MYSDPIICPTKEMMCMCGTAYRKHVCVREKRKRRGGEGMQRLQVVPYGFGRIALYKASWREGKREGGREFSGWKQTDRDGQWTMKRPVRQTGKKTGWHAGKRTISFRERGGEERSHAVTVKSDKRNSPNAMCATLVSSLNLL